MDRAGESDNGNDGAARWTLRLLGGFEIGLLATGEKVALPGKRERVLLAYLALSPKGTQPRRKLATLLWGDNDDGTALDNLRTTVWRLRKALGDTEHRLVASYGEDIVLDSAAFEVDALVFRRLADQSGLGQLETAAGLYSGEFLFGLDIQNDEFETWHRTEAARYREQAIDVLTRLMTQLGEGGETERAIEAGLRILQLEPLHEVAVRCLMRLYGRSGRRGAAGQLYRTLADALRADLDAEPEAETRSVCAEVARGGQERTGHLAGEDAGLPPPSRSVAPASPMSGAIGHTKPRMRGWISAGGFAVLMALFLLYELAPWASSANGSPDAGTVSVAVLPFLNLSGDDGQEFLSDGITEEITAALTKVPGLRVVARTSAFQFKGQNEDIQAISRQLHASHIIEGSVRREGDRLRVTAQLVEASGGTHLWSESYDRQLTDVFAIEEDIARTVSASLRVPLGLDTSNSLIANRGIDPESYEQYLRAKQFVRARTRGAAQAVEILEPLVARNAHFAPAWVQLSRAYAATIVANENAPPKEFRRINAEYSLKRTDAARRAVELDPNSAEAYWALAVSHVDPESLPLREELLSKALAMDPNNADILTSYGQLLLRVGHLKEALPITQKVVALEPFVPVYTGNLGEALWLNGENDAALKVLESGPRGNSRGTELARVYASMGRYGDAADKILESSTTIYPPELLADAARLLRMAPTKSIAPQSLPRLATLGFIYLYVGAPLRALEFYEEDSRDTLLLWHSSYASVRKTEDFKTLMRKVGLVDYWRAKGWPDLCHPVGADDFECS